MKVHKPTITDFTNSQHNHESSDQGGVIQGAGYSGFSGYSGLSGASGISGAFGLSGTVGSSGLSGASGASGASGTSGLSGASGTVGTSGYSGLSGASGASGASGFSGLNSIIAGASGYSGLSGASGASGASGYSGIAWAPHVTTITSNATPTINTDSCDAVTITALADNITSFTTNLSGTPVNFQKLIIRIKDNGTARTIAWGAKFIAKGVALPTTTVLSKLLTVGFIYDTVAAVWECVAKVQED